MIEVRKKKSYGIKEQVTIGIKEQVTIVTNGP